MLIFDPPPHNRGSQTIDGEGGIPSHPTLLLCFKRPNDEAPKTSPQTSQSSPCAPAVPTTAWTNARRPNAAPCENRKFICTAVCLAALQSGELFVDSSDANGSLPNHVGIFGHKIQRIRETKPSVFGPSPPISRPVKRKYFGARVLQNPIYRLSTISRMQHHQRPDHRSAALRNTCNLSTGLRQP